MKSNRNTELKSIRAGVVLAILFAAAVLPWGCGEHPSLPTAIETGDNFGANDTSFVRISPDWDAANGYTWTAPSDILVGMDGYLYVVDETEVNGHTNGRVVQLDATGSIIRDDIFATVTDTTGGISGIGQDTKLNLFMVDGTENVYCWNQYAAQTGVEALVQSITLEDVTTGNTYIVDNTAPLYSQLAGVGAESLVVVDYSVTTDPDSLAAILEPYLFFKGYYGASASKTPEYTDVAGGPSSSSLIYLTDKQDDRLISVMALLNRMIFLENGDVFYTYTSMEYGSVVGSGQGQGSANTPTSLVVKGTSSSTQIIFCQTAGNFRVQRLAGVGSTWYYDLSQDGDVTPALLTLDYFSAPMAVAVGESDELGLGLIYVADVNQSRVTSFFANGKFFREVGVQSHLIDLTGGQSLDSVLAVDGETLDEVLNPSLVDFIAVNEFTLELDSLQTLLNGLSGLDISYYDLLDPPVAQNYIASVDTSLFLTAAVDTTVKVYTSILDGPTGVATAKGVVFISDTNNNRILRYIRTDANTYLPDTGE